MMGGISAQAVRLLLDCALIFGSDTELAARTLADRLGELSESPWPTYRHGKPISADQTGRLLRRFGITPRKTKTGNLYRRDDVQAAAAKYSPTYPDPSSTSSTFDVNPFYTSTYGVELSENPSSTLHPSSTPSSTHLNPYSTSTYDDGGTSGTRKPPVSENAALGAHRPAPAAAAPVAAPAADAPPVELPPGWPSNTPRPPWWPEFISCLGNIRLLQAREQVCGDPTCQFSVAVLWTTDGGQTTTWSCPKCGRTSDAQD